LLSSLRPAFLVIAGHDPAIQRFVEEL